MRTMQGYGNSDISAILSYVLWYTVRIRVAYGMPRQKSNRPSIAYSFAFIKDRGRTTMTNKPSDFHCLEHEKVIKGWLLWFSLVS